jgi:hypothetical protein
VVLGETTAAGAGGITLGANTVIGTLKATNALTITAVGAGGVEKLDLNGQTVTITADDNIGVITSGAAGAVLTLPSDGSIGDITVGAYDIAIGGTPASVTIAELATPGAGKLVLPAAAVTFTATAGGGNISYAAAPASVTLRSTTCLTYVGNLSVAGAVSVTGPLTVDGEADFGETVTLYSTASFGGDVTVTATKVLTLSANAVTLAATKSIKVGTDIVLTAGAADVVLTPDGASTLTPASKELTLGAQNLALTSGALTVATGSTLVLSKVLTVAAGAELAVAGDVTVTVSVGGLTLTGSAVTDGAKLTGAGKVTAVAASIVGGTGGWQAVGEGTTITLTATGANAVSITGTGATPKLVGGTGGVISTGSNSTYSALTVQLLEIDLTTAGSIVIPHNSTASTIVLKGGTATLGKLTLDSAQITTVGTSHYVKIHRNGDANGKAGVTTDKSGVVTGAGDNAGVKAGSIAGGTTVSDNDMTITGLQASYDVTLDNTALFADS